MKRLLAVLAFLLLALIALGLIWFFFLGPDTPVGLGWYLFSFAAGLTMIVLPCTLPLAFVIVPLSLGKGVGKGLGIALSFGLGVALMLSVYGVVAAIVGEVAIGSLNAPLEVVKNWLYFIAGAFAYVFALGELGLVRFRMPSYSGAAPGFIQRQHDFLKAFLLGLFLGNVGVGCPHPATPVILTRIAASGDVFYGWLLFFTHAIGRILPLLFLAFLALLGVNALSWLLERKERIERATGWAMVFVAAFILVLGLFTHDWWVYSGQHTLLEQVTQEERFLGAIVERFNFAEPAHGHGIPTGTGLFGLPLSLGNWILVLLWVIPLWWYWLKEKKKIDVDKRLLRTKKWLFIILTILLALFFIRVIPHWFLEHKALEVGMEEGPRVQVLFSTDPQVPTVSSPTRLTFSLQDENGEPLTGLKLSHERILHVIIISEDLETFAHLHPEDFGPVTQEVVGSGVFTVDYTFPKNGQYLVALDYQHQAHEGAVQFVADIGQRRPVTITKDLSRLYDFPDGYQVSFKIYPTVKAGHKVFLDYRVEQNGTAVIDLEPYLGAAMHLAVVSVDLTTFIHTHGGARISRDYIIDEFGPLDIPQFGPQLAASLIFPHPGLYVIFGEFKHQGKVIVSKFMVEVAPGEDMGPLMPPGHE